MSWELFFQSKWPQIRNSIVLCMVLGCLTTIFVAWGIVLRSDLSKSSNTVKVDAESLFLDRISILPVSPETTYKFYTVYKTTGYERVCLSMSEVRQEDDIRTSYVFIFKEGWPLPCFKGEHRFGDHFESDGLRYAFLSSKNVFKKEVMLVWQPIPLPYLLNTIIFAGAYWFLICLPIIQIKHFRRAKGSCKKCGYDLRFSPVEGCPECGWLREDDTEVSS